MNNQNCTSTWRNQQPKGSSGVHELNIKEQVKKHFPEFTDAFFSIYTDLSLFTRTERHIDFIFRNGVTARCIFIRVLK